MPKALWTMFFSFSLFFWSVPVQAAVQPPPPDSTPPSAPGTPSDTGTVTNQTSITWTWTAAMDPESGVTDYQIDIGTSAGGSDIVAGASTSGSLSYVRSSLSHGYTYYARVRAINGASLTGEYSANSDGMMVDTIAPTIANVSAGSLSSSGAAISWTTNEAAGRQVRYGTTPGSYPSQTTHEASTATSHSVTLSGLVAATTYYYQVVADDAAGNSRSSSESSFTTSSASSPSPTTTTTSSSPSSSTTTSATATATTSATASSSASPSSSSSSSASSTSEATVQSAKTKTSSTTKTSTSASSSPSESATTTETTSANPSDTSVSASTASVLAVAAVTPKTAVGSGSGTWFIGLSLLLFLFLLLLAWLMWRRNQAAHQPKIAKHD